MKPARLLRRFAVSYTVRGELYRDSVLSGSEVEAMIEKDYLLPQMPKDVEYFAIEWRYDAMKDEYTATAFGYERVSYLSEVPREIVLNG